jgi:hypothetical protein
MEISVCSSELGTGRDGGEKASTEEGKEKKGEKVNKNFFY